MSDTPQTAAVPVTPETTPLSAAEILYGNDPDVVMKSYRGALMDSANQLMDATGMDVATRDAHIRDVGLAFHDAGISASDAANLHHLIATHTAKPADATLTNAWRAESHRQLVQRFGAEAEQRLAAAQAYLATRPALAKALAETGVGDHPTVVVRLAEQAGRYRTR